MRPHKVLVLRLIVFKRLSIHQSEEIADHGTKIPIFLFDVNLFGDVVVVVI